MILRLNFLNIFLIIVNVLKGKADSPASITQVLCNVRGSLVRIRSMHVALSGF